MNAIGSSTHRFLGQEYPCTRWCMSEVLHFRKAEISGIRTRGPGFSVGGHHGSQHHGARPLEELRPRP
jgi:hypothetical protein